MGVGQRCRTAVGAGCPPVAGEAVGCAVLGLPLDIGDAWVPSSLWLVSG